MTTTSNSWETAYDIVSTQLVDDWENILDQTPEQPVIRTSKVLDTLLRKGLSDEQAQTFFSRCKSLGIRPKQLANSLSRDSLILFVGGMDLDDVYGIERLERVADVSELRRLVNRGVLVPERHIYRYNKHTGANGLLFRFYIVDGKAIDLEWHVHLNAVDHSRIDVASFQWKGRAGKVESRFRDNVEMRKMLGDKVRVEK